ncbi:MAG TPA: UDP-glucuronic acid decarboxylase family protein [Candidatus Acidoferrales bacterium]|nr:UDP-glucuronic acid decarboxylase family protein [Candidatus Acidoferrales bacterium]
MANVIVTGGAGFIGSHLCDALLEKGYDVVCIDNFLTSSEENIAHLKDNPHFTFINHDVIKPLPDNLHAEYVFHLASPASPNHHSKISYHNLPMETMQVNTNGTLNILQFAAAQNAKFLFTSTSEVYGDPLEHPQKESYRGNVSTIGPRAVYDEAKRFGETLVSYFWREKNVDARIARIFNTYGPRMSKDDMRMITIFINQALANEPLTIYGDGKQTRSLSYVSDTVEGLMRLMFHDNTRGEVVNIGSANEHTVLEYAELVKRLADSTSEITFSEQLPEDDPLRRRADIAKAKELLDWEPEVPLEEGIKKMIEYVKKVQVS